MRNVLTLLCVFAMIFGGGNANHLRLSAQDPSPPQIDTGEELLCLAHPSSASCTCVYPSPGCYPSAPVCGTTCGVSYLSMGVALALVVGVAALILSEGVHSH